MDEHTPFGLWLRRKRKSLDLSQLELAERASCSPDTIQKIEAGTRRPSRQVAGLLAEALSVPPDEQPAFVRHARGRQLDEAADPTGRTEPEALENAQGEAPAVLHLPPQLTTLIGREHDIIQIGESLLRPDVRLLTLLGPPGIGKTRLSVEVAAAYGERFAGGACFVALAAVEDPDLVVLSIAQALGVREGTYSPLERLKRRLHDEPLLLVLDNFEQVLDAAPALIELLGACPRLSMLVTSREALHVPGERQYPVPLLEAPEANTVHTQSAALVERFPAVQLFVERATAVHPGFKVSDANASTVAGICARLDGLPLAIELAAARTRLLSPHEILAKLDGSLALLSGGSPHLPPRQRTLRGAIEWSYRLLDGQERQLFNRLGVFAGGCTLAAAAIALPDRQDTSGDVDVDVLNALASLVDKSLLRQVVDAEALAALPDRPGAPAAFPGEPQGDSRFVMLETMRAYAVERLRESGELRATRLAHAGYFLALVEAAMPQLLGSEQAAWLKKLEHEHDNLRAALGWLAGGGPEDVELALRMCCFAALFWDIHGHLYEGRRWLSICLARAEQWIDRAPAEKPETISPAVLARAYKAAGNLANRQGDPATSRNYQLLSLELYRQIGDRLGEASACMNLGNSAYTQADYATSRAWHERAIELFRELADTAHTAMSLNNLGNTVRQMGEYELARELQHESLEMHRQRGDNYDVSMVLSNLGWGALCTGDYRGARALLEEALGLARQLDYKSGMAMMHATLGFVAIGERAYGTARSLLERAQASTRQLGDDHGMAYCLWGLAALAQAQGDYRTAREQFRNSLGLYRSIGASAGAVECIERLARVHTALAQPGPAVRLFGAAAKWRDEAGVPLAPIERADQQRAVAAAREQLGRDEFDRAWAEGQALTLDEASAAALAEVPPSPSS